MSYCGVLCGHPVPGSLAQSRPQLGSTTPVLGGAQDCSFACFIFSMTFFVRITSLLWLLLAALGSTTLTSCDTGARQNTAGQVPADSSVTAVLGAQPLMDSTQLTNVFRAEPAFKAQLLPARRFYRERKLQLGWFRNHQPVTQVKTLEAIMAKAADEGLNPKEYQFKGITAKLVELEKVRDDSVRRNALERQTDIALTGIYMKWPTTTIGAWPTRTTKRIRRGW